MKINNKKGLIELGKKTSIIILIVFGFIIGFFAIKLGYYVSSEILLNYKTEIVSCRDGSSKVFNGSGFYCGQYVESLEDIEKIIEKQKFNNGNDLDINIPIKIN
jgi:hypothetical protein